MCQVGYIKIGSYNKLMVNEMVRSLYRLSFLLRSYNFTISSSSKSPFSSNDQIVATSSTISSNDQTKLVH